MLRVLGLLCLLLPGCTAITLRGLDAALRLDPLNTPADSLTLAVALPPALRLADGDARLQIALAGPDGPLVSETVPLTVTEHRSPQPGLPADARIILASVAPVAAARFAAAQAEIRRLRDAGQGGQGSLSISITGGCLLAPLGGTLPIATWLRPAPDAAFIPLTRQTDIFEELPPADRTALRAALAACP